MTRVWGFRNSILVFNKEQVKEREGMKIRDQVILVTGGGSGLGEATSRYLAKQGAKVIVMDKSEKEAKQVADSIKGFAIACDVTQEDAVQDALTRIAQQYTVPLSVVVNCAGIAPAKRMVGKEGPVPLSWFAAVVNVNLIGTFNVMRLSAAHMLKSQLQEEERGVIINTASIAAFEGQIGQTAYSASKGGIVAMTLPAARELAKFGIRVMTIAPGLMETPMLQNMPPAVQDSLHSQCVFPKRLGKPAEFAELVGHIIVNTLLNGEVIRLDGGVRLPAG